MSHFAKVENGIVTEVIVAEKNFINTGLVGDEFLWVQTSYNGNFRGKYAATGDTWNGTNFIPPQPFDSWTLNEDTCVWEPPTSKPDDGNDYTWNEENQSWDVVADE